jgi:ribonuclease HII
MNPPVRLVCGIDEAGRGPLAGPVCAAAVVLAAAGIAGLADSKTLAARRRSQLAAEIRRQALACGIGWATVEEIDRLNILRATLAAMRRAFDAAAAALHQAGMSIDEVLVDGNALPDLPCLPPQRGRQAAGTAVRAIVRGDATVAAISAASILAKTERDAEMRRLSAAYPQYGFERHKGYGTRAHLLALARHGASPAHRRSFAPVACLPAGGRQAALLAERDRAP